MSERSHKHIWKSERHGISCYLCGEYRTKTYIRILSEKSRLSKYGIPFEGGVEKSLVITIDGEPSKQVIIETNKVNH